MDVAQYRMARVAEHADRAGQVTRTNQHVVRIVGRNREDADPGGGKRRGETRENAGQAEIEWPSTISARQPPSILMSDGMLPCSQTIDSSCGVLVTETKLPVAQTGTAASGGSFATA